MKLATRLSVLVLTLTGCTTGSHSPTSFSFQAADRVLVTGHLYGKGPHGVVLVPGAHGIGEAWHFQAQRLARRGFRVLAMDYRGLGVASRVQQDGEKAYLDVLGAVHRLEAEGAGQISVIGASWGGRAAAQAALAEPGLVDRLILIAPSPFEGAEKLAKPTLIVVAADDRDGSGQRRLVTISSHYQRLAGPKRLIVVEGAAHAQFLFLTPHGERLYAEILRFLRKPIKG